MSDRQPTPGVHENFADKVSAHDFAPGSTIRELKPCPFCGGDRLKHFGKEIQCQQCQALGPLPADGEVTHQIVIDWWNRRASAPEPAVSRQQSYICIADGRTCKVISQDDGLVCFVWDGSETTRYLGAVEFEKRFRPAPPPPQSHLEPEPQTNLRGEPVAWRVRVKSDDPEEWTLLPAGGGADYRGRDGYECQPLYVRPNSDVGAALKLAIEHIEHMAAHFSNRGTGYSFESLGEDMPGIKAALATEGSAE